MIHSHGLENVVETVVLWKCWLLNQIEMPGCPTVTQNKGLDLYEVYRCCNKEINFITYWHYDIDIRKCTYHDDLQKAIFVFNNKEVCPTVTTLIFFIRTTR